MPSQVPPASRSRPARTPGWSSQNAAGAVGRPKYSSRFAARISRWRGWVRQANTIRHMTSRTRERLPACARLRGRAGPQDRGAARPRSGAQAGSLSRVLDVMCLIVFAWRTHPRHRLILAANRDEYFGRPTAPAAFWDDHPGVLAGRDLEAGGTWLGITPQGRFAA